MAKVRKVRRGKTTIRKARVSSLPSKPNEIPQNLLDFCFLIYGKKAIGKTTLANMLSKSSTGKAVTWMLEKGRRNLRIYQLPKKGEAYPDWDEILVWAEDFIKSKEFDVLVIDTIDRLYDLCFASVCAEYKVKSPAKAGRDGSGIWVEIAANFNALLQLLSESGKGVIFISHEKIREIETKKMRELKLEAKGEDDSGEDIKMERIEPSASPAACRAVEEMCDFVFYFGMENRKRTLTVRDSGDYFWVACGVQDRFLDPDDNEISTFYLGDTPQDAKKTLLSAFDNKERDIDWKPPKKKKPLRRKVRR